MDIQKVIFTQYKCGKCGKVWGYEEGAENCCKHGECSYCGNPTKSVYVHICESCRKERYGILAKEKLFAYESGFDYDGPVYDPFGEEYFYCLDELKETYDDEGEALPPYVGKCDTIKFSINPHDIIENAFDDFTLGLDDPDCVRIIDRDELIFFIEAWNNKQPGAIWEPGKTVIILDHEWFVDMERKFHADKN